MVKKNTMLLLVYSLFLGLNNCLNAEDKGLAGWWKLDAGAGDKVIDLSGQGNDGKINGAKWAVKTPGFEYVLEFNGVDDYVDCGKEKSLDIPGAITMEAWVKYGEKRNSCTIVCRGEQYWFGISREHIFYNYKNETYKNDEDGKQWIIFTACAIKETDRWYHVAVVNDPSSQAGAEIYLNGALQQTDGKKPGVSKAKSTSAPLYIGTYGPQSGGYYFPGIIKEIKIYNRCLSAEEIKNHNM